MSFPVPTILLSDARQMIERSIAAARALDVACSIAVVDSSGHLLCFVRQDGAMAGSAELAIRPLPLTSSTTGRTRSMHWPSLAPNSTASSIRMVEGSWFLEGAFPSGLKGGRSAQLA